MNRHQAVGAYRPWTPPSFDAPAVPPTQSEPTAAELLAEVELLADDEAERHLAATLPTHAAQGEDSLPPPPAPSAPPDTPDTPEIQPPPPAPEDTPEIQLPTAEDIERIHEEARKDGYEAGYEEGTARGRIEAMHFHGLVESLEQALTQLDKDITEEILSLSIELARQMVRQTIETRPESLLDVIREALAQLPQAHAQIHVHPEDLALCKEYLGEHLSHSGHRLVEDPGISRGGARIEASGSHVDGSIQTRWRRIMESLGRNVPWDGDDS
ncbi:flagellar assembly protein FliH [Zoogloea sp.]|uniref:flagellar assembly protein FliH n=1 Tax=Zoogloea sp. TaxID=49181 RepID=UPI00263536A5|nr:flagellar assembly protein FliH [Zoogloea sp.]MDD3355163.1 flagellar assembly protein FliH [Zoogloea sp.]